MYYNLIVWFIQNYFYSGIWQLPVIWRRHFPPLSNKERTALPLTNNFGCIEMADYVNELKDELGQIEQIEVKLLNTHRILTEGKFISSRLWARVGLKYEICNLKKIKLSSRLSFLRGCIEKWCVLCLSMIVPFSSYLEFYVYTIRC